MRPDARQHVRYKVKDGILAVLPLPGKFTSIVGHIIDISESGLALRHTDEIPAPLKNADLILMGHEDPKDPTPQIPARLIYEKEQGGGYRSGFQFDGLSRRQMSQLACFIQSNIEPITV